MTTPYSAETHGIPTININLAPCDCHKRGSFDTGSHHGECSAVAVPIPCPIPRSAFVHVAPGACDCMVKDERLDRGFHAGDCAGRPIRVACSIGGKTWEESEVVDVEQHGPTDFSHESQRKEALAVCRTLWEIVKALVLGRRVGPTPLRPEHVGFIAQRDTVYAALADMARAEDQADLAQQRVDVILPKGFLRGCFHEADYARPRSSQRALVAYVEHLIEQVGVL